MSLWPLNAASDSTNPSFELLDLKNLCSPVSLACNCHYFKKFIRRTNMTHWLPELRSEVKIGLKMWNIKCKSIIHPCNSIRSYFRAFHLYRLSWHVELHKTWRTQISCRWWRWRWRRRGPWPRRTWRRTWFEAIQIKSLRKSVIFRYSFHFHRSAVISKIFDLLYVYIPYRMARMF